MVKVPSIQGYSVLLDKQSVFALPIRALAGPGAPELGLHSIHSYGYASHSSPALVLAQQGACPRAAGGLSPRSRGLVPAQQGVQPHLSLVLRGVAVCAIIRVLVTNAG